MAGTVEWLPYAPGTIIDLPVTGSASPIRSVTRQVAFEGAWDLERRDKIAELFDSMAAEWSATRDTDERRASIIDALDRGSITGDRVIELGAGSGLGTAHLARRFSSVVALDLSMEMLRAAPSGVGLKVRGDSSSLPFPGGSADVLTLVNMLLFPAEVDRVLAPRGCLVWVNTQAHETPIYLSAEDVVAALPGSWNAVASRAGSGSWCVARRADSGGV
jgi:SAM-dependent methyltransferase